MDSDSFISATQSVAETHPSLRLNRSNVHDHCRTTLSDELSHDDRGQRIYYCKYCPWAKSVTTNFRHHLRTKHQVTCTILNDTAAEVAQKLQDLYKQLKGANGTSEFDEEILQQAINQQAFKQCLIDLVVVRSLSLSILSWPEFHMLCKALNPKSLISILTTH